MVYKARYKEIIDILNTENKVFVSDLSPRLGVSEVTIRKDLSVLEKLGMLRRFHSGAVCIEDSIIDLPVKQKLTENIELKIDIAEKVLNIIENKTSIIIDSGSTTNQIANLLKTRNDLNIKIVTNSMTVGQELAEAKGIDLVLTGGNIRVESQAMVGPIVLKNLSKLHVDTAFIGAMGVSVEKGFASSNIMEAEVKQAILKVANKKIVVADHTKLDKFSFAPFASLDEIDILITDSQAPVEKVERLRSAGLEVIY
ncbi:MAG: DeoR/GlpR transcriptional regulator [Candidatus Omnitrophica bacterium]|nr:DeoR/GlpR transcriptional regulator [Candidatus Omnitrophota bacterium]MCK4422636.1 DeoR/GlpR transcriptional regulator [Candidatus Omnitrophota bacterium]